MYEYWISSVLRRYRARHRPTRGWAPLSIQVETRTSPIGSGIRLRGSKDPGRKSREYMHLKSESGKVEKFLSGQRDQRATEARARRRRQRPAYAHPSSVQRNRIRRNSFCTCPMSARFHCPTHVSPCGERAPDADTADLAFRL